MKKWLSLALVLALALGCVGFAAAEDTELVVYGSCEEEYLAAACKKFQELTGIKVSYQRLSTGEVYAKVREEAGKPSADVWFGGTTDPYNQAKNEGLLVAYEAENAKNLRADIYRDPEGYWYGVYVGYLGFICNIEELDRMGLSVPMDWPDLLKPEYEGLVAVANPGTAGTGKQFLNTIVQLYGHDEAMEYFAALDKNIIQYPKVGAAPSRMVGPGEIVIGIGFLHDGIYQIMQGYDNIVLVGPVSGTSFEIGPTAIFEGCAHPDAARLWIETCLSGEITSIAADNGSYQFLTLNNVEDPAITRAFNLSETKLMDYDFTRAAEETNALVEEWYTVINNDGRVMVD